MLCKSRGLGHRACEPLSHVCGVSASRADQVVHAAFVAFPPLPASPSSRTSQVVFQAVGLHLLDNAMNACAQGRRQHRGSGFQEVFRPNDEE